MPEVDSHPDFPVPGEAQKRKLWPILGFAVLAVAFAFYLRLFLKAESRSDVFAFFFTGLLPTATIHTALFLVLTLGLRIQARGTLIFWSVSALALLAFGGWTSAEALLLILAFGFISARIGIIFAGQLFPQESLGWGISLGIGILLFAVVGAFLAWAHVFTWWALAILIVAALIPDIRSGFTAVRRDFHDGWRSFLSSWNPAMAFSLQALFLLGAYVFVAAMAPETNSDAVRFYWPYIKLLRHYGGFFDGPRQWAYIIPQAGLVYGAAVLSLLGRHAVRLAMVLVWASLIGIMCRRSANPASGVRFALAILVGSCPVILWITGSLMQDGFVCLAVMILAALCLEGSRPGSALFWCAIGICLGATWSAKYSVLVYAVPLMAFATHRSFRASGWIKTIRGLIVAGGCALATLLPWFVHSYLQSNDPIFPFFLKVFNSPVWPRGVGFANLDRFRLPPGWRGWLLWPIDMTYRTGQFVEGYDGKLGLTLVVLLILVIAALWKGNRLSRALALSGIIGTALLWTQTAYLRYWMPTLWLIGMAGSEILERRLRFIGLRVAAAVAAAVILMPQVLFTMIGFWPDARGWPWKIYAREVPWEDLIGGGFQDVEKLLATGNQFPKIWFTGYEPVGHLQVQPMEAVLWELTLHTTDPRSKIQYLTSAGCEYWLVNEDDQDALWFRGEGIANFFWNKTNLVARAGPIAVYRMPPAAQVLRDFDARSAPGTDLLLNGGFEDGREGKPTFWFADGEARQMVSNGEALEGQGFLRLRARGGMRQGIALPPGVHNMEVVASARGQGGEPASVHYVCYFLGFPKDPSNIPASEQVQPQQALAGKEETVAVQGQWQPYHALIPVPELARYVVVSIDKPVAAGEAWVDAIHVYVR